MGKDGKIINETEDNANNFWVSRASDWIHPLKGGYTLDPTTGARYFGAPRSNGKRAHAGIDLIAEPGTEVLAMTDGEVINIYDFYAGTQAVEVKNSDGTSIRYVEIKPTISVGSKVEQRDIIGKAIANTTTHVLQFQQV